MDIQSQGHSRSSSETGSHLSLSHSGPSVPIPPGGMDGEWRSTSMVSVSSDGSTESHLVEQEDIVVLTHDVKSFTEALGKLRRIFQTDLEKVDTMRMCAHERLGEVLRILRSILEKYPPIQSTELLMTAGTLIQHVKSHNYEDERADPSDFFDAIDQLALAFSSRVSEYLMGDLDPTSQTVPKTKSCDNLVPADGDVASNGKEKITSQTLSASEIDQRLMQLGEGVDLALRRAKIWSKYAKDVMTYIEKRANAEAEHARNLAKIAQATRPTLKEESFLPFQSIYCTALDQDLENSHHCLTTCALLNGQKFIEPLTNRKLEHEKTRKHIKDTWQKELKRTHDSYNNLRKARSLYIQRHQEHDKAKDSAQKAGSELACGAEGGGAKLEKKRRLEEEALQKSIEAETIYKACVFEANERQTALVKVKSDILRQVRELIYQCDQTMKAVTVAYFQLQHTVSAPAPVQFQTLCESSRLYEPGSQYMEFAKRLPVPVHPPPSVPVYVFEPYSGNEHRLEKDRSSGSNESEEGLESRLSTESVKGRLRSWHHQNALGSDSDSISSFHSNKSQEVSPTASPRAPHRAPPPTGLSSGDELETDHDVDGGSTSGGSRRQSKAAQTHTFRKLRTPSRCRECDSFVSFHGMECTECGLSSHRKCLENLAIQCGHKRLPRRMTTFGVPLGARTQEPVDAIPDIVTKCIHELDEKGQYVKGIYRVSGVKSKVEKLCQSFENGAELVDLTDVHPSIVANVLKLYFRQLPEPLLTFKLYPDFVAIAKDHPVQKEDSRDLEKAAQELSALVKRLPPVHLATLAVLMQHLKRMSENCEHNHMPPSNLGIVFGPTLLRTSEGGASLSSLVDTVHQTRVIELLITLAYELFGQPKGRSSRSEEKPVNKESRLEKMRKLSRLQEIEKMRDETRSNSLPEELMRDYPLPGFMIGGELSRDVSLPASEEYTHSSDDWLATSIVSDDDFPDLSLQDDSKRTDGQQRSLSADTNKSLDDATCPIPPPRRTPSSKNIVPLLGSEDSLKDGGVYTSSVQVTLSPGPPSPNSSQNTSPGGTSKPASKITAELRRQFFESPPLVFKSDSLSQFVTSASSTDVETVPSSDSGSSLAAGSESSESDRPTIYRSTPKSDYGSRLSQLSTSVDRNSPLTSSISHLGLNSLLRPFATSVSGPGSAGQQYNGKWHTTSSYTSVQRERRLSHHNSASATLQQSESTDTSASSGCTAQNVRRTKSSDYGIIDPPVEPECPAVWQQTVSSHHVSSVKVNQSSTVREFTIRVSSAESTDTQEPDDDLDVRNPEFV